MSTKLAADESNVENVSIKNRPMNIAEEYQLLCSNQWLDAKTALDDITEDTSDIVKLYLLSEVMMVRSNSYITMNGGKYSIRSKYNLTVSALSSCQG